MFNQSPISSPPTKLSTAIGVGILCGVGYLGLSYVMAVALGPSFSGGNYGMLLLLSVATVGVPVTLWFRYRLLTPLVLMGIVVVFWQVVVPLLGNEGDGTPVFALAVSMAPLSVIGYALSAAAELWLQ